MQTLPDYPARPSCRLLRRFEPAPARRTLARGSALIAGLLAGASLATPPPAEAASAADCQISGELGFNSGIDFSPKANRWETEGARISCHGELGGRPATGQPGLFYAEAGYRLETQCASEGGRGTLTAYVPVVFGRVAIHGKFTYTRSGSLLTIEGEPTLSDDGFWPSGADERVQFKGALRLKYREGGCAAAHRKGAELSGPGTVRSIHGGNSSGSAADAERCVARQTGTAGSDEIRGSADSDWLEGLGGRDRLDGLGGADCLFGGEGRDRLSGGEGADDMDPGSGRDQVAAGPGADRIDAADGARDVIRCGPGEDRVRADAVDRLRRCELIRRV